jgi:hypothetical protein
MLVGIITCLVSVVLLGLDGQFVDSITYPQVSLPNYHNQERCVCAKVSLNTEGTLMNPIHSSPWHIPFITAKLSTLASFSAVCESH